MLPCILRNMYWYLVMIDGVVPSSEFDRVSCCMAYRNASLAPIPAGDVLDDDMVLLTLIVNK